MDGVVGTLEEVALAVLRVRLGHLARLPADHAGRHHDAGRDVVLGLHLDRRMEVVTQAEDAPRVVLAEADAQRVDDQLAAVEFQRVPLPAVDHVDRVVLAPVVAPFRAMEAFDDEDEFLDVLRNRAQPLVVLVVVFARRGREQLDDAAHRALVGEDQAVIAAVLRRVAEAVREVAREDGGDRLHIAVDVRHINVAFENRIRQRFRDFRLAAARYRRWLVAVGHIGRGTDEVPLLAIGARRLHLHAVTVRPHVGLAGEHLDRRRAAVRLRPTHRLRAQAVGRFGRHQHEVRVELVERMTFRLRDEAVGIALQHVVERVRVARRQIGVLLPFVVAREDERTAGVFLLREAVEVGRVADLRLHFLLAVAEVVVGNQRHDHATRVACADLEGVAAVVQLALALVAHAVAALPFGRRVPLRQPEQVLGHADQMRREDHAAAVPGPAVGVERGVVFRQVGVAAVAEDRLDEVEIGDQRAGDEEASFHALFRDEAGHAGHDQRTQLQRDVARRRHRLIGREGQPHRFGRWIERQRQQARKRQLGHGELVIRHRQAAFDEVEDAGRRAPVARRVVQHAVAQAIAGEQRRLEVVAVRR